MLLTAVACLTLALALALATVVYFTDRDSARPMLMPDVGAYFGGKVFRAIGQWLPSFVHPRRTRPNVRSRCTSSLNCA